MQQPDRTLIYRRRSDGSVIGIAVDAPMLAAAAGHDAADEVARDARPLVLATGASPSADLRTIDQVPLGEALPHLPLALVNPVRRPIRSTRSIRPSRAPHIVFTSALAIDARASACSR